MRPLSLNLQTLFADLAQRVASDSVRAASVSVKEIKGKSYIYVAQDFRRALEKRRKDLLQAADLMAALEALDPWLLKDALHDALRRGPKWRDAIARSLIELNLERFRPAP